MNIFILFGMDKNKMVSQAINSALTGAWAQAVKCNLDILKLNNEDCETLNRLGQAYKALGQANKSLLQYKKVLKYDKYNKIALRNIEVLKNSNYKTINNLPMQKLSNDLFLEEVGKTKLVSLINLAPSSHLLMIVPMQKLQLIIKRKSVFIEDMDDNYLGSLPDDLSYRMIKFLNSGYKYDCIAKSIEKNSLHVIIREIQRSKRLNNQPTFPLGTNEHDYMVINSPETTSAVHIKNGGADSFQPKELAGEIEPESQATEQNDEED